jgi:hypothetical protein
VGGGKCGCRRREETAVDSGRARQLVADVEQVTIQELTIDLLRAVDLALELGLYAHDGYILEAARSSRYPLLTLDQTIQRNAKMPVVTQAESPFANVSGRSVNGVTSEELLRTLREDGWKRGARMIRRDRATRLRRTKGRAR